MGRTSPISTFQPCGVRGSICRSRPPIAPKMTPLADYIGFDGILPVPCTVLDPFSGAGTTCLVAEQLGRDSIGIELNPEYAQMSRDRIEEAAARRMIGDREPRREDARQAEMFA